MWTEFNWLRLSKVDFCEYGIKPYGSKKKKFGKIIGQSTPQWTCCTVE
jgi:hypothetical protein